MPALPIVYEPRAQAKMKYHCAEAYLPPLLNNVQATRIKESINL